MQAHPAPSHHLPEQTLPFFGRADETAEVVRRLHDPACRLATLAGPGGVGKSRLALRAAGQAAGAFAHGCHWADLQPVAEAGLLPQALAAAADLTLSGAGLPTAQLARALRHKRLLLVLDNFEHLLDGAGLLPELLQAAPGLKLLVTSREALNLREEWLFPLEGLDYPDTGQEAGWAASSAARMFADCAQRAVPGFDLEAELPHVARICRQVQGLPLAIELAAAWVRTLGCAEIALEIERGLDVLTARLRDLPERHRSMRAVFEQTARLLPPEAAQAFQRLSVFRGGFTRAAAERVAGAGLSILAALVDKALVTRAPGERYGMHELVRQYAAERLAAAGPGAADEAEARHAAFYFDLLAGWEDEIMGAGQKRAIAALAADLENIRAAWLWAAARAAAEAVGRGATAFAEYCQIQSRYPEAADIFERCARALPDGPALALSLAYLSGFYIRVGRLAEAEAALERCADLYHRLGIPPVPGFTTDPAFNLGILALTRGDYAAAEAHGAQMRQTAEAHGHRYNRQLAYHLLAEAALGRGDYAAAREHARQSLALLNEAGNRWFMAYTHNQLGAIARALGDFETAREHFEAGRTIREAFRDPEGIALALCHLGEIALQQGAQAQAEAHLRRALALYEDIEDRGGCARALAGLGEAALTEGDLQAAREHLRRALAIAREIDFVSLELRLVAGVGELLLGQGALDEGARLLSRAAGHPAAAPEVKERVAALLGERGLQPQEADPARDLPAGVAELLDDFPRAEAAPAAPLRAAQPLIDPLSERELEVLRCVADGLQNREIADRLFITVGTVKSHVNSIYRKLDVRNRVEATARARELDLL